MFIFKDFKLNIIINVVYKYKVDSLILFPLVFLNLLTYIFYIISVTRL
jgi:hypothetical protein